MTSLRIAVHAAVSVFQTIELAIAAALFAAAIGPGLIGWETYCVMSGSMQPTLAIGSLAYIETGIDADSVAIGDAIAFRNSGNVVVHRVVGIEGDAFATQGDANESPDPALVQPNQLIGILRGSAPGLGALLVFLDSNKTAVVVVLAIANIALCIVSWSTRQTVKPTNQKRGNL